MPAPQQVAHSQNSSPNFAAQNFPSTTTVTNVTVPTTMSQSRPAPGAAPQSRFAKPQRDAQLDFMPSCFMKELAIIEEEAGVPEE